MSELKSYDLVDIQDYRGEVYLKAEADKVIAELKYKRCLAMAKWCLSKCSFIFQKCDFYCRWYKKWSDLAEKFKEAK